MGPPQRGLVGCVRFGLASIRFGSVQWFWSVRFGSVRIMAFWGGVVRLAGKESMSSLFELTIKKVLKSDPAAWFEADPLKLHTVRSCRGAMLL
jgi:hypothetical protein